MIGNEQDLIAHVMVVNSRSMREQTEIDMPPSISLSPDIGYCSSSISNQMLKKLSTLAI